MCLLPVMVISAEAWHDFAAGWVGGSLGVLCGHPLDTVKVRQQALHVSPLRCLQLTLRHEGPRALFKGLAFPLVSAGGVNAVFFGAYYNCLRWLDGGGGGTGRAPLWQVGAAGAVGGVVQLSVAVPVEVVKIQLQTRTGAAAAWTRHYQTSARGPLSCLAELRRRAGVAAWYQGLRAQLYRDVPASAAYFVIYEAACRYSRRSELLPEPATVLLAGGMAGLLSWTLILPFDVVKSRLQAADPARPEFSGALHCARMTVLRDGPTALMRGFSAMALRGFVVNAATFLGYEYAMVGIGWLA